MERVRHRGNMTPGGINLAPPSQPGCPPAERLSHTRAGLVKDVVTPPEGRGQPSRAAAGLEPLGLASRFDHTL